MIGASWLNSVHATVVASTQITAIYFLYFFLSFLSFFLSFFLSSFFLTYFLSFFLSSLLGYPLPNHCRCRVLMLHLIALSDTYSVVLLWTSDRSVTETCTGTTRNIHKRQTTMLPEGFEPAIPANERPAP